LLDLLLQRLHEPNERRPVDLERLERVHLLAHELAGPVELLLVLGIGGEVPGHRRAFRWCGWRGRQGGPAAPVLPARGPGGAAGGACRPRAAAWRSGWGGREGEVRDVRVMGGEWSGCRAAGCRQTSDGPPLSDSGWAVRDVVGSEAKSRSAPAMSSGVARRPR